MPLFSQSVEIRDGWFYVDGRKFFVKGIGYESHTRPGQVPWEYRFEPELLRLDMARIQAAGYNTIRTWQALSAEELAIVEESGLKVLLGLWIDPHGDYGDPAFVQSAVQHVNQVLAYSKNSAAILGYLIMNEPTIEDMVNGGPTALVNLWQTLVSLIHQRHPGIPVSVAQAAVGDFVRTDLFDFVAFNLYVYNPAILQDVTGYAGFVEWLKQTRAPDKPLIITEFGLSVSPGTPEQRYGYGRNTLEQQARGNLAMLRGLMDGGAQGGCVFQYHDGWWKAGNPGVHDDNPEEWFGLFAFSDLDDSIGFPRPAWERLSEYNRAMILSPANGSIYSETVPVEIQIMPEVARLNISWNGSTLLSKNMSGLGEWKSNLNLAVSDSFQDVQLRFDFIDSNLNFLKTEIIRVLVVKTRAAFPELKVYWLPESPQPGGTMNAIFRIDRQSSPFAIAGDTLRYGFFPHIGFDPGEARTTSIASDNNSWSFTDAFRVPPQSRVFSIAAGFDILFGSFRKRLYSVLLHLPGHWADPIAASILPSTSVVYQGSSTPGLQLLQNYPNPFNGTTTIAFSISEKAPVHLTIHDLSGRVVYRKIWPGLPAGTHSAVWQSGNRSSGIYFLQIKSKGRFIHKKLLVVK